MRRLLPALLLVALTACTGAGQPTPTPPVFVPPTSSAPASPTPGLSVTPIVVTVAAETPAGASPTPPPTATAPASPTPRPTSAVPAQGQLAFVSTRDGNSEIYLLDLASGAETNLTNNSGFDYEPAWSPDGARLAFISDRDGPGGLYHMAPDGSDVVVVAVPQARVAGFAWSPDGARLAFVTLEGEDDASQPVMTVYVAEAGTPGAGGAATPGAATPGAGAEPVEVAVSRFRGAAATVLAWSPDGTRLVFPADGAAARAASAGQPGNTVDLHLALRDGRQRAPLTASPNADYFPAWSPDGARIVFTRGPLPVQDVPTETTPWLISVSQTDQTAAAAEQPLAELPPGFSGPYVWLDAGRLLLRHLPAGAGAEHVIYLAQAQGGGQVQALDLPVAASLPALSADGRLAAFDALGNVYVALLDDLLSGQAAPRQATTTGRDSAPAWRP